MWINRAIWLSRSRWSRKRHWRRPGARRGPVTSRRGVPSCAGMTARPLPSPVPPPHRIVAQPLRRPDLHCPRQLRGFTRVAAGNGCQILPLCVSPVGFEAAGPGEDAQYVLPELERERLPQLERVAAHTASLDDAERFEEPVQQARVPLVGERPSAAGFRVRRCDERPPQQRLDVRARARGGLMSGSERYDDSHLPTPDFADVPVTGNL